MCSEEGRVSKALDEAGVGDHQLLARTPTGFSADGDGEKLHLQFLELDAGSHEGELESRYSPNNW